MQKNSLVEQNNFAEGNDIVLTPMETDRVWIITEPLIEIYSLLVHRIEGIGLSLDDFWKMDTFTVSKLYLDELYLIERENKKMKGKGINQEELNDPATEDLYYELFGDD